MASPTNGALERCKSAITAATSVVGAAMLLRRLVADVLPAGTPLVGALLLLPPPSARRHAVLIEEFDGAFYNRVFVAARAYVSTLLAAAPGVPLLKASLPRGAGADQITLAMRPGTAVVDVFQGVEVTWRLGSHGGGPRRASGGAGEVFRLSFDGRHKDVVIGAYLPFVMARVEAMSREQRHAKLYSNEWGKWRPVRLRNASTFATLAMDAVLRQAVVDDLEMFLGRKEYYERTGRAWKRGYLIHGPPGTGKSSLVAAISNHLHFDVYDLDLSGVRSNTELRKLLIRMKNRSILLIEDVDCAVAAAPRRKADGGSDESRPTYKNHKVTLSGLLNMVDGLWSSSGHERILIFTTNHMDRLDQALLRPGRMDMHIHMGYCSFSAFKELVVTYHNIDGHHPLFPEIEALLREVDVAPAELTEKLLATDDVDAAVEMAAKLLRDRKAGATEDGGYVKQKLHMGPTRPRSRPMPVSVSVPAPSRRVPSSVRRMVFDEVIPLGVSRRQGSGTGHRGGGGVHGRGRGRR
ncbi:AAA-ATPase At3g50940-like [Phragmites australis]|uniref:AAA-ATPase At3g50940-like n=1 Tax=Phragmites australis TaxID=29695 RepID=UPI002D7832F2|nr:AAA-ATPase At3g50940-like [Phragmites australis]